METTLVKGIEYTYNKSEIDNLITKTIENIEKIIKENDYQVNGNHLDAFGRKVNDIDKYYALEWKHFSYNQMKKIQKYCFWVTKKPSLRMINTFFNLLSKYFELEKVRVSISLKEEKIQKARKEWMKARDEAERLLSIYKLEKGDFYKNKLNFFTRR